MINKNKIIYLARKSKKTIREEGVGSFFSKSKNYVVLRLRKSKMADFKDVLFINGCYLPHPQRYRVDHQMEQLESYGYTVNKVTFEELTLDMLKYYRCFVFYRCPITPTISEFIDKAHYFNKKCFFDIDDLVINTKYTNQISFIQQMSKEDKKLYDDGVHRMEETLKKCDYLITSTNALGKELKNYKKDVLVNRNVASERMAELSLDAIKEVKKDSSKVIIGYLSGSITHNADFELIKNPLIKVMEEHENVYLQLMGHLDVPEEFAKFGERVMITGFKDWQSLPKVIRKIDINLAPLEKSIFNEAKSENKWMEAALCKTITIASNLGAFKDVIVNNETGLLCNSEKEWYDALSLAINNKDERERIANNAHNFVIKKYITTYSGLSLAEYIESKLVPNYAFVLPTTNISGGVNVVVKHCNILRGNGYDAMIISMGDKNTNIVNKDGEVNVISYVNSDVSARFDTLVATLWSTLDFIKKYPDVKNRLYLVQGFETDFGKIGQDMRRVANSTYNSMDNIKYITVSKWCQSWLKEDYNKDAKYIPNGIELDNFEYKDRKFTGKIKVLVEGNSSDFFKNIDESFKIIDKLDKDKYEIIYLSYEGEPKKGYYVDKFYHKVPHDEVGKIYQEADILLKSSFLESFSYPPLEMMATGGVCVVVPNDGNVEYLKDNYNCLFYEKGNIDQAVEKIESIRVNKDLRDKLIKNGKVTASSRDWKNIEKDLLKVYE